MESATRRRDRGFGARGVLFPLEPLPPREERDARPCADGSTRAVRRREGKKKEGGISTRSAIDSVRIQLDGENTSDRRESLDSSSILTRI